MNKIKFSSSLLILGCLISPVFVVAQLKKPKVTDEPLSLVQAFGHSKTTKKIILVDAYASWCLPCYEMDKNVLSNPEIQAFISDNFIATKVKMDSTNKDSQYERESRNLLLSILKNNKVEAFPTFLFFTPDTNLIFSESGSKTLVQFRHLLDTVLSTSSQYNLLKNSYISGQVGTDLLKLALLSKKYNDNGLTMKVAKKYKHETFDGKFEPSSIKRDDIEFIFNFLDLFSFEDSVIRRMYQFPENFISVMPGVNITGLLDYIVKRDYIKSTAPLTQTKYNEHVNWSNIVRGMTNVISEVDARRVITDYKTVYYAYHKKWLLAATAELERINLQGLNFSDGVVRMYTNAMIFDVFFNHVSDTTMLNTAINLMKGFIDEAPNDYYCRDTYANLLYKVGKVEEGINQEKIALKAAEQDNNKESISLYQKILTKMKNGQPTWIKYKEI